ncbi:MAG: DUF58 domain-containing protein [Acidobacteriota bacterium]
MHWWQNLRTLWPGALRQQVTRTGLAYSGAIVIVTLAAVLSANNLLFLILAAMLSILAISGFVSKLTLAGLEIDLLLPPHISARRTVRATVRLKNLKRWMPSFSIRFTGAPPSRNGYPSSYDGALYFTVIPGGVAVEEPIDLSFPTRGRHSERTFQLTTGFPFGFAERRETVTLRHDVIVYPCLDPRPSFQSLADSIAGEIEAWRRGPGHDFYRIRPYEALESARHVDWKATAHTRSLQVREFARDEDQMIVIFLDLDATADQRAWFETAVECAAFVAFHLSETGHRVRLRTQDFDLASPAEGDIYAILGYLALVSCRKGARPPGPDQSSPLQIVLTANPERMSALGWGRGQGSRILGPGTLGEEPLEEEASPSEQPLAL